MKPEEQPGLLLPPGTGLPWNKLFLRQIGANPPAKGQPRCVFTGQGTVYPILGQSFEVPASHQEIFAPLSSDRRENLTPGSTQGAHPCLWIVLAGGGQMAARPRGTPPGTPSICQRERASNREQKRTGKHWEVKPGDNVN